nr:multiple epidermal growth factor-like domains protein 6 isoform X1 [Crassostrea gigas]
MRICAMKTGFYITIGLLTLIEDVVLRFYRFCSPGYYGYRCQESCRYPRFGHRCKEICVCRQSLCNHIKGCPLPAAVCPVGFTGKNCEEKCNFPNYGYGCQQQCSCPKVRCSTVNGCQKIKPNTICPYLKTKSSFAPSEKTTITAIRGIQTEPLVKNNSNVDEGVTLETQLDSQRKNGPINEKAIKEQIENTILTKPTQKSKVTWMHIAIISVGGMLAVIVIAHVIVSIINCVNVNCRLTHP